MSKQWIKYGCDHESDGMLVLDSTSTIMLAYLDWARSVGVFGDKSQCFKCYCASKQQQEVKIKK